MQPRSNSPCRANAANTASVLTMVALVHAVLTTGCAADLLNNCEETATCAPLPAPPRCEPDPAIGERLEDRCSVFVSVNAAAKDINPGTQQAPVQTIARAIELAKQGPMRIYAEAGTFQEAVVLPTGVEIWGGMTVVGPPPDRTGPLLWSFGGLDARTTISPGADHIPLEVDEGISGTATVANLLLQATTPTEAGADSLAMLVKPSAKVRVLRSDIVAAHGAAPGGSSLAMLVQWGAVADVADSALHAQSGAPGAEGESGAPAPAPAGFPGRPGAEACSKEIVPGGDPVQSACGPDISISGAGGTGNVDRGEGGYPGQIAPSSNEMGHGAGGEGQITAVGCTDGRDGARGIDGIHGQGASQLGSFGPTGWVGPKGGDGGHGTPGQGGGGGGGARGGRMVCGDGPQGGASGGSGGSGGCGGTAGKGGGAGGASIGLYVYKAKFSLTNVSITTGNGGTGGNGGRGQFGGVGGPGGPGGARVGGSAPGCSGGYGGAGGNGANGGGGLGGHVFGIVTIGDLQLSTTPVDFTLGMPGEGGDSGTPHSAEGKAGSGLQATFYNTQATEQ
jgi:hypothetical protein